MALNNDAALDLLREILAELQKLAGAKVREEILPHSPQGGEGTSPANSGGPPLEMKEKWDQFAEQHGGHEPESKKRWERIQNRNVERDARIEGSHEERDARVDAQHQHTAAAGQHQPPAPGAATHRNEQDWKDLDNTPTPKGPKVNQEWRRHENPTEEEMKLVPPGPQAQASAPPNPAGGDRVLEDILTELKDQTKSLAAIANKSNTAYAA